MTPHLDRITADGAPAPIGPYSPAVRAGPFVFLSGQTPLDPSSGALIEGDVEAQTERVLANLHAVLVAAGLTWSDVVRTTIFMTDLAHFATVNRIYERTIGDARPARTTIQVAGLPRGAQIEIEMLAGL